MVNFFYFLIYFFILSCFVFIGIILIDKWKIQCFVNENVKTISTIIVQCTLIHRIVPHFESLLCQIDQTGPKCNPIRNP